MKNYDIVERDKHMHRLSTYIHEYEKMDSGTKYIWEEKCRKNLDQHPYIKDSIVNTLFQKHHQSWRSIEGEIYSWCSQMTIERFVESFYSLGYYKEHIVLKISPNQQKKNIEFSKLVYERKWDFLDGNGNFLDENNVIILIRYDEMCFWGLILLFFCKIL